MSFLPLPGILKSDIDSNVDGTIIELGSGNSFFTDIVSQTCKVIQLDLSPHIQSNYLSIKADALMVPLREKSIDIILVPNLWRHISNKESAISYWLQYLNNSGVLYLFEDDVIAHSIAEQNYLAVQSLLAKLSPIPRGKLLSSQDGISFLTSKFSNPLAWSFGVQKNEYPVKSIESIIDMISLLPGSHKGLMESIANHGISYGRYWWARYSLEAK